VSGGDLWNLKMERTVGSQLPLGANLGASALFLRLLCQEATLACDWSDPQSSRSRVSKAISRLSVQLGGSHL